MMTRLRDRPTADLIVIFLAAVIGFYVVGSLVALVVFAFIDVEIDVGAVIGRIGQVVSAILGAVVGYIGGRATGASEASKEPPTPQGGPDDPST